MHVHRIGGPRLNQRIIPNPSKVVVPTTIGGLLEVVMQRRIEDAELCVDDEYRGMVCSISTHLCAKSI